VKDHQKARETKNSKYKKRNIKTERIRKLRKLDTRTVYFSKFREAIGENQQKESSAENTIPALGSSIIKAQS